MHAPLKVKFCQGIREKGKKEGRRDRAAASWERKNPKIKKEVKSAASSCKKKIMEERIVKEENFLK